MSSSPAEFSITPQGRDPLREASRDRRPPYSEDAEVSVLSAMLLDAEAVTRAVELVDETMFYREGHRRIFQAISDLFQVGEPIEPITVIEQLTKSGDLDLAGGRDAVLDLMPAARVGYIGLQRDETTAVASAYYSKLPGHLADSYVLVVDPMLATGGSAVSALSLVKKSGAKNIKFVCIVAATDGVAVLEQHHPDVHIYTPTVDPILNAHKYIVPGLGDFGDRLYGTTNP